MSVARTHEIEWVVECTRCDAEMRVVPSATRGLHYLVCPDCGVRYASCYDEVIRAGAAARRRRDERTAPEPTDRWHTIRGRAAAWQDRIDDSDPYRVLGLPAGASLATARARYHELAQLHHPDRGGDPRKMVRVIEAYRAVRTLSLTRAVEAPAERQPGRPTRAATSTASRPARGPTGL